MKLKEFILFSCSCLIIAIIFNGCATSTGVFPSGKDTYTVVVSGMKYDTIGDLQKTAYKEAYEYCQLVGKKMQPIATSTNPSRRNPSFELRFRALSPDDLEYRRPDLESVPDIKVDMKGQ